MGGQIFLCAVLTLQVCLIFVSMVMRYFLNRPLSWSDEMATFMLVYVTFLGTYVASNTGHLAKVELLFPCLRAAPYGCQNSVTYFFRRLGWLDRILLNENVFFQHYSEPGQFRLADSDAVCLVDPAGDNVAAAFFGSAGISAYIYSQK
ncbi:MAG: TRAP transporter small permease [Eisenbergiella sp.]